MFFVSLKTSSPNHEQLAKKRHFESNVLIGANINQMKVNKDGREREVQNIRGGGEV